MYNIIKNFEKCLDKKQKPYNLTYDVKNTYIEIYLIDKMLNIKGGANNQSNKNNFDVLVFLGDLD
jgi:hypothetical protein